jgi:putative membrane protein
VRTGVAVIAFGFAIEKFDLFLPTPLDAASLDASRRSRLEKLSDPRIMRVSPSSSAASRCLSPPPYDLSAPSDLLDDPRVHPRSGASAEIFLSAVLALIVAGLAVLLALAGQRNQERGPLEQAAFAQRLQAILPAWMMEPSWAQGLPSVRVDGRNPSSLTSMQEMRWLDSGVTTRFLSQVCE